MLPKNERVRYIRPLTPIPTGLKPVGQLQEPAKSLVFDIYGTLFISGSGDIGTAQRQSKTLQSLDRLLADFDIGQAAEKIHRRFFKTIQERHDTLRKNGTDFPEVEIDRIWMDVLGFHDRQTARDFAIRFELMTNPVYPMPHAADVLSACRRKGLPMGIISNAQFYTRYLFQWFLNAGPDDVGFDPDLIFFSYRFGRAKPSEVLFRRAAEKLGHMGLPAPDVLYVGNDMRNDVAPAQKVGFKTALFAGDARSLRLHPDDPQCRNLSADLIITDLIQLLDVI